MSFILERNKIHAVIAVIEHKYLYQATLVWSSQMSLGYLNVIKLDCDLKTNKTKQNKNGI